MKEVTFNVFFYIKFLNFVFLFQLHMCMYLMEGKSLFKKTNHVKPSIFSILTPWKKIYTIIFYAFNCDLGIFFFSFLISYIMSFERAYNFAVAFILYFYCEPNIIGTIKRESMPG
jgi:hypothetical protein